MQLKWRTGLDEEAPPLFVPLVTCREHKTDVLMGCFTGTIATYH